ncbi:MAG: acyl-CoA dehydrogenase family protein, partial [Chloroflexi bacterium]|nr:acyl-CoA dehydrogenase family protein [Chloroflexota bacterium]
MDFTLSEDQKLFQQTTREFVAREIEPAAARIDESNEFPAEIVARLGELGLQGVSIPEKLGGSGGDTIH